MTDEHGGRETGLVVQAGGARWLIPAAAVVEVLREPALSRLPGTSAMVSGAVNHRGRVLVVADPVRALELAGGSGGARDVVVVEVGARRFALALDAVIELVTEPRTGLAEMDLEAISMAVFG